MSDYYPNGKIRSSVFTEGYGKGSRRGFFETGLKRSETLMDNDVVIFSREWHPDQSPKSVTYFKNGRPFLTKEWSSNGSLEVKRGTAFHQAPLAESVQQFIRKAFPDSEKRRMALTQLAEAKEMEISESNDRAKSLANVIKVLDSQECVFHVVGIPAGQQVVKDLEAVMLNTEARLKASLEAGTHFGGQTYSLATAKEKKSRCDFDPDKLPN
jgi:hypothetical protein